MHESKVDPFTVGPSELTADLGERHGFRAQRRETIQRLARAGIPLDLAVAWVQIWDRSTAVLPDFRAAPDFWSQGFRYALEEYRRGYRPVLD